jgi:uncharacterized protein (TIGR04255 family)
MAAYLQDPLYGSSPPEVHLARAPIVRVIGQIRFPPILSIRKSDTIIPFQERIRGEYPLLEEAKVHYVHLGLDGAHGSFEKEEVVWRFSDRTRAWRVSLTSSFVALETSNYVSRRDFLERLEKVLAAMEEVFKPQDALRLGLRYVDRMVREVVAAPEQYLNPAIVGSWNEPIRTSAQHFLTEALLQAKEGLIQARWGFLPGDATIEPGTLEPIPEKSWLMDLDMFTPEPRPFVTSELLGTTRLFAERLYTVFRWMVTDNFLHLYGGKT